MLSPEVWDFKPTQHHFEVKKSNDTTEVPAVIKTHYFNHSVSLVLPDTVTVPDNLKNCILEDSDYYQVKDFRPFELLNQEFIEAFIKRGEVTLLTIGYKIDLHNSIAVTPQGDLVISLLCEDFQKLGLEGKVSFFDHKIHNRYIVTINLKDKNFIPGNKNYERARTSLKKRFDHVFDVILIWEPTSEQICPSSVAAWFHKRGYNVTLCQQKFLQRTEYSLSIPDVANGNDGEQFFEWLGIFSIGGDVKNSKAEDYVNTYKVPEPSIFVGQIQYLQWTGFFTRKNIEKLYTTVKEYISSRSNIPWYTFHIQGFTDSPVSWCLKEHTYTTNGDNNYTILFRSNIDCSIRRSLSSNNKPRIRQ